MGHEFWIKVCALVAGTAALLAAGCAGVAPATTTPIVISVPDSASLAPLSVAPSPVAPPPWPGSPGVHRSC